jgi:hypothetical protein
MSVVVVTGGRFYSDRKCVYAALDVLHAAQAITLLIHGACPVGGADILGEEWAQDREIPYMGIPAKFRSVGKSDGPARSRRMLEFGIWLTTAQRIARPRVCFFPGNAGTGWCVQFARELAMELYDGVRVALAKQGGTV